jgi:hypothetical protein
MRIVDLGKRRDFFRDARRSGKLGAKRERVDGGCGADD